MDRTVSTSPCLAQLGLLQYKKAGTSGAQTFAKKVMRNGYSLLRSSLTSRQKSRLAMLLPKLHKKTEMAYSAFTSIDWSRTKAYCSEVLASPPSIWINLRGGKPQGIVHRADHDASGNTISA